MATLDRIRLTGLLPRSPAPAGLLHASVRLAAWPLFERLRPRQAELLLLPVAIGRRIVVVADEDHDVWPDRTAELTHRREDAGRRIGGEAAGQSQPSAGMELEADPVSALDDPLRRRVPVQRCAGGVGEDRHAL